MKYGQDFNYPYGMGPDISKPMDGMNPGQNPHYQWQSDQQAKNEDYSKRHQNN